MEYLLVIDMQNDFVDGSLGSADAQKIVPNVAEKVKNFTGKVIFTRDTHQTDYLATQEGEKLPVAHCVQDTHGWQIIPQLQPTDAHMVVDKPTFGSMALAAQLAAVHQTEPISRITLVGLCTDICVISNAMLCKAALPEVPIEVDAACCAGVTLESHINALEAMKMCQIGIENA